MSHAISNGYVQGSNYEEQLRNVYRMYEKALLQHKVTQREEARARDLEDARHAEAGAYGRTIAARMR
jgi:hypothetical protein